MNNLESDKTKVLETYPGLSFKKVKAKVAQSSVGKPTGRQLGKEKGRQKGVPNKATVKMRDFWQQLCEKNQPELEIALTEMFKQNPGEAFKLVLQACEYFTPKIARTELTGKDGSEIPYTVTKIIINQDPQKM